MRYNFPFNYEDNYKKTYNQEIINHVSNIVEKTCRSENNKFGYNIWRNHILIVVKYAKILAQQMQADEDACEIAALLHDLAGISDINLYENHHIHSAKIAHELLTKLDYPKDKIELIKSCIISHRASKSIPRKTKEAQIVASADAIAHILAWESLMDLALEEYKYSEEYAREWVSKKLARSYEKIMPEAISLIQEKYKIIKLYLDASVPLIIE